MTILRPFAGVLLVLIAVLATTGCSPVVRNRTLPPSIRSVHVPMALNRTAEPGLEEGVTVALQREILADGRLELVREKEADAVIRVTLNDFDRQGENFDEDRFPTTQAYDLDASVVVEETIPGRPAIGGMRRVSSRIFYNADPRTYDFKPEPDAKNDLYETMARQLLQEILTGDYTEATSSQPQEPRNRREFPALP